MPRPCAVVAHARSYVAPNVKLHGASPWHLYQVLLCGVAAIVTLHGTSPWHLAAKIDWSDRVIRIIEIVTKLS